MPPHSQRAFTFRVTVSTYPDRESRQVLVAETGPVSERLRVQKIDDEGRWRLVWIIHQPATPAVAPRMPGGQAHPTT
jgi:hypothetical protein